jgi:large-conductance mechanosensitive channel
MTTENTRTSTIFNFILSEKFITLTVLGSIFTFSFISSLKNDVIDPLLHIILPEELFEFMNIVLREGEKPPIIPRQVEIRMGNFFKEFITWMFLMSILFILANYTKFPDHIEGNKSGAAIM